MYQRMKMLLGGLILSTGLVVATPVSYAAERYRLKTILKNYKKYAGKKSYTSNQILGGSI